MPLQFDCPAKHDTASSRIEFASAPDHRIPQLSVRLHPEPEFRGIVGLTSVINTLCFLATYSYSSEAKVTGPVG